MAGEPATKAEEEERAGKQGAVYPVAGHRGNEADYDRNSEECGFGLGRTEEAQAHHGKQAEEYASEEAMHRAQRACVRADAIEGGLPIAHRNTIPHKGTGR